MKTNYLSQKDVDRVKEFLNIEGNLKQVRLYFNDNHKTVNDRYTTFEDWLKTQPTIEGCKVTQLYLDYSYWCIQNNLLPIKKVMVGKKVTGLLGFNSVPTNFCGKTYRVYEK